VKTKNRNQDPQGVEKQLIVSISNSEVLQSLVGERDQSLKIIERELDVRIGRVPQGLSINGQDTDVDLASNLLTQIRDLLEQGDQLFPGDIERSIKMLSSNRHLQLSELFRDQIRISGRKFSIVPKTFMQKSYLDAIKAYDLVFGIGPAGTGKTYLAMAMAVTALLEKKVKRIILCRPAVEAGEKLGFLPGDMAEKVNPYLRPLYDALHDMVEVERAQEMIEKGVIEVAPLAFMRGRTLSNAFVILDEGQNTTPVQMKMLLTRIGFNSKCVITGDVTQIDLPRGAISGLSDAAQALAGVEGIEFIRFSKEDVVRHPLVSRIVAAYDKRDGQGN
jgi:phosphate starvation-inducible protein PhoH and related proteins